MTYRRCDKPSNIYTVGLIFNREDLTHALLMRKSRPEWQAGLLNAPGGKVEEREGPLDCIHREMREETGLSPDAVTLFARLHSTTPSDTYSVCYYYVGVMPHNVLWNVAHEEGNDMRDEPLAYLNIAGGGRSDMVPNLRYFIEMGRNRIFAVDRARILDIYEGYEEAHVRFGGGY